MKKDKNSHEIDLNKYKDLNGLSIDKMNFGLWLSENRKKITRLIIIILIAVSAFFFFYSSYNYIVYFLTPDKTGTSNAPVSAPHNEVADLTIGTPQIFKNGASYDLISKVSNPNSKFVAHFQYCFSNGSEDVNCGSNFLMPSEEKYVLALGQKIASSSVNISFKISNVSWQRIDAHNIPDWTSYANDRLNFNLENIKLSLDSEEASGDQDGLDTLEFTMTNRTAFSYYEVPLNIIFYRDSEIVGADKTVLQNFLAGETRNIRLAWPSGLSGVTRTEIRPELDLLNDSIYQKYQGAQ